MPVHYNDIFDTYRYMTEPIGTTGHFEMDPDSVSFTGKLFISPLFNKFNIKKVVVNPKKNATTVIFVDGSVEVVKRHPNDPEADIYSVVAYAVAKHVYGSNSALKRQIGDKVEVLKNGTKEK